MTILELLKIIWGSSLVAVILFGVFCAASPTIRAQLWGDESPRDDRSNRSVGEHP